MRRLELWDLNIEDHLLLTFNGTFDQQAEVARALDPLLLGLERYADGWMPDVVKGKRRRKYARAAIWKALEEQRDENSTHTAFFRTASPEVELSLRLWFPPLPPRLSIWLDIQPLSFFAEAERCRRFMDMVHTWASHYPVSHASAHSMADDELSGAPYFGRDEKTTRRDGFDKVYEVFWLNIFGARLVEEIGRERMLSTPAHRVEELPGGAVLLVTWPTAADYASEGAREAQARALVHLRPELDMGEVLRGLRERSAALAPVEPRFHPDVAALLARVVGRCALSERQRKVAEFNAYQPPEPQEWLPAGAALPSDVEDVERARAEYATQAEHLVALLHAEVPSVFEETPESLTDVDHHFWREDFPNVYARQHIEEYAVPAVGAYLGEVLVRNLGGRWIPRRRQEEAQVVVGERVWLPMVRARRYLRSRQALLDYSLTQLYRVAQRSRS
jgi:hypothetical protein